jgi:hypothetical protein
MNLFHPEYTKPEGFEISHLVRSLPRYGADLAQEPGPIALSGWTAYVQKGGTKTPGRGRMWR